MHPLARAVRRAAILALPLALAACSGSPAPSASPSAPAGSYPGWPVGPRPDAQLIPVIASSQLAIGPNRVLFSLADGRNQAISSPQVTTDLAFYDLQVDPAKAVSHASGSFIWAIEGKLGLYHASATFDRAGDWGVEVTAHEVGHPDRTARVQFTVLPQATTPAVGAMVPAVDTPTASDASGIALISTDKSPDPDFYRISEQAALTAHRPFVLVFATPQFCQSQICGPTLDNVKAIAGPYRSKVAFIHVEPYVLKSVSGQLQPVLDASGNLQLVPAATAFGLPSEPWVFVVGADGRLAAKFEGNLGKDELTSVLDQLAAG